jgi:glycosyltransferase involved in cell wall biosynthesis
VRGGPSQAVLETLGPLRRHGVEAEIATTDDDGPRNLDVPHDCLTEWQGVPVRFFRRFSPAVHTVREFAFSAGLTRWLWAHARDYDLLHVHALFSYPSSMAMRVARARHVPYLCRPSGLLCRWSLTQSRIRKQVFLGLFDRANLNGCAAIEYTAEHEREESADVGLDAHSFVLPYGLHIPPENPNARTQLCAALGLPSTSPILLFMSRLHVKKGLAILIEALEKLAALPFSLIVAGSGAPDYEREIRARVASGPLSARTHFVGFASGDYKQSLLQGADLFALPSFSESFAISALEAIVSGTPVLTTPGVPLSTLIEKFDLGWVAPPEPSAMSRALERAFTALADAETNQKRRARGRKLVTENFSWDIIAGRMAAIYEAAVKRTPLPSFELSQVAV